MLAFLFLCTSAAVVGVCKDAADCGYNGQCDASGSCACRSPWKGIACASSCKRARH